MKHGLLVEPLKELCFLSVVSAGSARNQRFKAWPLARRQVFTVAKSATPHLALLPDRRLI